MAQHDMQQQQRQMQELPTTLWKQQPELRERIRHGVFERHYVPSGLYADEQHQQRHDDENKCNDDNDDINAASLVVFRRFVNHVRHFLAQSPRTVLRAALEHAAFSQDIKKVALLQELGDTLLLLTNKNSSKVDEILTMHQIATAMNQLSPGKCFRECERLRKSLGQERLYETDPCTFRERIAAGVRRRRRRRCQESSTCSNSEDEKEIEDAVVRAIRREQERTAQLQEKLAKWSTQLESDPEYLRFQRAHWLYRKSGGQQIWENYLKVDEVISKKRGERGQKLEARAAEICFAMIVSDLIEASTTTATDNLQKEQKPLVTDDFTYRRNVFWWRREENGRLERVGEVDLAVLYKGQTVVAICEMKTSCFEIAAAMRQHETKLKMTASSSPSESSSSSSSLDNSFCWSIGETYETSYEVSGKKISPKLYFCTILPDDSERMVGVEPLLVKAVCKGIRSQGSKITDALTVELCRRVAKSLLNPSSPNWVHETFVYLRDLDPEKVVTTQPNTTDEDNGNLASDPIDYERLRSFVSKEMVAGGFQDESPLGCLKRCSDRMLVLTR